MMNRKRDRSPPSASADESPKLCLICSATIPDDEKSCVYAIILDPNLQTADSDGFILNSQPAVRFDGIDDGSVLMAYCVSKSTLYIIESDSQSPSETFYKDMRGEGPRTFREIEECARRFDQIEESARLDMIAAIPVTKTVYSFDLAQSHSSSEMVVVQKSELQKLPDMLGGKLHAEAVHTPQGKILVFSSFITHDLGDSPQMVEVELYDPDTRVWSKLPPLYDHIHNHHKDPPPILIIFGYGFLTSSVYFVSTCHGNYVIDLGLEEKEKCWQKHELLPLEVGNIYFIGEDGVCLTDYAIKSTRDWGTLGEYPPLSSFPDYNELFYGITPQYLSALVGNVDGGGCFDFCTIKVVHHNEGGLPIPFFILDLFCANKFSANKFITSKERCLKFSPRQLGLLFTLGLFSVQFST